MHVTLEVAKHDRTAKDERYADHAILQLVVLPERCAVNPAKRVDDRPVVAGCDHFIVLRQAAVTRERLFPLRTARIRVETANATLERHRARFRSHQRWCAGDVVDTLYLSHALRERHRRLPVGVAGLQIDRCEGTAREA